MKSVVRGGSTLATTAALAAFVSVLVPAVAGADDPLVGKTYADASAVVGKWGKGNISLAVESVVGDRLQRDDCIVTHWDKSHLGGDGRTTSNEVRVTLNCNGALAAPGSPGDSVASPAGQVEKKNEDNLAKLNANHDWCFANKQNHDNCVNICNSMKSAGGCTFDLG